MALLKQDHQGAFRVLLERHELRVVGFAAKYLGDRALADDACQTTFLRLWKTRRAYEARGRFRAFLVHLCLNVCRETTRSARRRSTFLVRWARLGGADPEPSSEHELLHAERTRVVEKAVANLPRRQKEAVLLRFFSDLSYAEMGQILRRPEGTLRNRVHRALKQLQPELLELKR